MKYTLLILTSLSLLQLACGAETLTDRRQGKGVSLDALSIKPVSFEFNLPDRKTLAAEIPDINSKMSGYFYKVQGEGNGCPSTEVHEGSGAYDDGRLIALNVIPACNYLVTVKLGTYQAASALTAQASINYQDHVAALVQTNCVSCHASYANYAGVKDAARAMVMAVEAESMPPSSPLAGSDIALFLAWADAGYLEKDPAPKTPSVQEQSISKVYYRNNNSDYILSYELLGRSRFELQRSLWLQAEGQAEGLQTKQLYTFFEAQP